jgi:C4-dicarboxylate-specific signal transduction histidine kinase
VTFLRAAASQVALAMTNASAFAQLEAWNARLEQQVEERTAALEAANAELGRSVRDVRAAYRQLEEKQASLIRSDRLATLGRLTAGIAHEVNTPLGAVVSTLSVIRRLCDEYTESIDDPAVTPADHHQIAQELVEQAQAATAWARKSAAFINRVRVHARDSGPGAAGPFRVQAVIMETEALLAHRLRGTSCELRYEEDGEVSLVGDATRLGQVIVNLVANAIDAYEDHGVLDGRIEIRAGRTGGGLTLTVRDQAGGIPAEVLSRIFDEMFTTKEPGRGTGIGLCIARNLVEQTFGGTLTVDVDPGGGTCFTIAVPAGKLASAGDDTAAELRDAV